MKPTPGSWKNCFLAGLFLLTACEAIQVFPVAPTNFPGMVNTYAAETMAADLIRHPPTYTSEPATPTSISSGTQPVSPHPLASPSRTPLPSLTPTLSPTPTAPMLLPDGSVAPCNAAEFVKDVSIPDATLVRLGQKFTKVWELKNVGNCTWTKDYAAVLIYGNPMGVASPVPLRKEVRPGQTVEISLNMQAPYIPACWVGWWKLQDEQGNRFGIGFKFQEIFWIKITVYIPGFPSTKKGCEPKY